VLLFQFGGVGPGRGRHEVVLQGTGFYTKDSNGNGISQHATDTGGFLVGYRFHFNRWLAAAADYGYVRSTQQNFTSQVRSTFRATSTRYRRIDRRVAEHLSPAALRPWRSGALVFDPTGNAGWFRVRGGAPGKSGICVRRRCGLTNSFIASLFVLNIEDLSTSGLTSVWLR